MRQSEFMLPAFFLSTAALLTFAGPAATQEGGSKWEGFIGIGVQDEAKYPGSDETETDPGLEIDLTWDNLLFIKTDVGIGGYVINSERSGGPFNLGFAIGYDDDERLAEDDDRLEGLDDVEAGAALRALVEYELGPADLELVLSRGIGSDGHEGTSLEVSAGFDYALGESTFLTVTPFLIWADSNYTGAFYGVSGREAAASQFNSYSASSGIERVGIEVTLAHFVTERFGFYGQAEYGALQGDAKDSPIVQDDSQVEFGLGVVFNF